MVRTIAFIFLFCASVQASEPSLKWYGFVLPFVSLGSAAVESFGQPNGSAVTAAGNPVVGGVARDDVRGTFQVAQSRVGLMAIPAPELEARLELDFIDFAKASPTTGANPRLRRAVLNWKPSEAWKFVFGQDWDLISPLMPFTYNFVGHFFEAGDIGFMRHQFQVLKTHGASETGIAVGLPQQNTSSADGATELTVLPTLALRQTWNAEGWSVGASALAAVVRASAASSTRITSGALTVFGSAKSTTTEVRSEAYYGRNTANLGMLGLSFCNAAACSDEVGFYVSGKKTVGPWGVFTSLGGAAVLDPSQAQASYNTTTNLLNSPSTGPGIETNWTVHAGLDYQIAQSALVWAEASYWNTHHHLAAGATESAFRQAVLIQVGSQVTL